MSESDKPKVMRVRRTADRLLASDIFEAGSRAQPPRNGTGVYRESGRDVPVYHRCDVLVVGGGPSGTAAAYAAAHAGADVVLLERYNHLGGLSTGGLVIWIDRMTDWEGRQVIRGFAEEVLGRFPREGVAGPERQHWGSRDPGLAGYWGQRTAAFHGVVSWSPTIDPERLKLISQEMLLEAGVRVLPRLGGAADRGRWAYCRRPLREQGRPPGADGEGRGRRDGRRRHLRPRGR
jgi:hypothetical protein